MLDKRTHHEDFIRKSRDDAEKLQSHICIELSKLGPDPNVINSAELKVYIKGKLDKGCGNASQLMEQTVRELWDNKWEEEKEIAADGTVAPIVSAIELVKIIIAPGCNGGDFALNWEKIVIATIEELFDGDKGQGMQIFRFEDLRRTYIEEAQRLVADCGKTFNEKVNLYLEIADVTMVANGCKW